MDDNDATTPYSAEEPTGDATSMPPEPNTADADAAADSTEHDPDDDVVADIDDERSPEDDDEGHRVQVRVQDINQLVVGELVLHYPDRDVTWTVDGPTALRVLHSFAYPGRPRIGDRLDPETSPAFHGWMVLEPEEVMAMSWTPRLDDAPRLVLDPPPAPR